MAWLQLTVTADLGIIHITGQMQELHNHGGFYLHSKESLGVGGWAMCNRVGVPAGSPERVMHEAE
jgi:hypothetical protein